MVPYTAVQSTYEVVYPTSDKLIELLYLAAVADTPAAACEFFHSLLKLHY